MSPTRTTPGSRGRSPAGHATRLVSLISLAILTLAGCAQEEHPVLVWSNVPEVAFLVERYNHDTESAVRFRYVSNLAESLTQQYPEADVVIGRWINTPPVNALMVNTAEYVGAIGGDRIPPELRTISPQWLPLSFNLPTIVARGDTWSDESVRTVTLAELANLAAADGGPLPFAPLSDSAGVYAVVRSLGFVPEVGPSGEPDWNPARLTGAIAALREWQETANGGFAAESAYIERYLYDPPHRQLETRRVRTYYGSSERVFTWRFFDDRRHAFRWLTGPDGRIYAGENVVYGGIPEASTRRAAARRFLQWIVDPAVQRSYVAEKIDARVDSFGFLDGFSTIDAVNRSIGAEIYPQLLGRVPRATVVEFSGALPRYWNEAREVIVEPYLVETLQEPVSDPDPVLRTALDAWYRQRGD